MYGMEIANEATELYSKLCMNMMKVEHKAIMTENASMLSEAEDTFIEKAKAIAKRAYNKFIAFLEKVKASWGKLVSSIQAMFFNTSKFETWLKSKEGRTSKAKIEGPTGIIEIFNGGNVNNLISLILASINNSDKPLNDSDFESLSKATIDKMENDFDNLGYRNLSSQTIAVDVKACENALVFLKNRKKLNFAIDKFKKDATKAVKEVRKDADKEDRGEYTSRITWISRYCSKLISYVNKATSTAIKICRKFRSTASGGEKVSGTVEYSGESDY